jgi:DNA-binding response OmpR family regulator
VSDKDKVLIVEDNEFNMNLPREHRPPLVLLDIHLPGMDGRGGSGSLNSRSRK